MVRIGDMETIERLDREIAVEMICLLVSCES